MNEEQLKQIEDMLTERKKILESIIANNEQVVRDQITVDPAGDSQLDVNHPADMVTGEADLDKELNLLAIERAELKQVDQALWRLQEGVFGVCESCGTDIKFARLQALPFTIHCIECQRAAERMAASGRRITPVLRYPGVI